MKAQIFHIFAWILTLAFISACNGLDDNQPWETATRSNFFLTSDIIPDSRSLIRLKNEEIVYHLNETFGVPNSSKFDFSMKESTGLLSHPEEKRILEIDLTNESISKTHTFDNFNPGFAVFGDKYIFATDSTNQQIAFVKIKKGKQYIFPVDGNPAEAVFKGGKFYLRVNCCEIAIYHETAFAELHRYALDYPIQWIGVDKYGNVEVLSKDSGGLNYVSLIEASGDVMLNREAPVSYRKSRLSPWFSKTYGTEYLENLSLLNYSLNITGLTDSVENFEMDFFEGILFYQFGDSLSRFNLNSNELQWRIYFPFQIKKGYHFIGTAE